MDKVLIIGALNLLLSSLNCFGQSKPLVVLNDENKDITSITYFQFGQSIDGIPMRKWTKVVIPAKSIVTISAPNYLELKEAIESLLEKDTIYLFTKIQEVQEVTFSSEVRRKESDDSLHVVDFHFVRGSLYTLEKSKKI